MIKMAKSICLVATLFASGAALAINGMYLTGYGVESVFMGGADVAVARDAFAANNNPAGMTQLAGQALDIEVVPTYDLSVYHSDALNSPKPRVNHYIAISNGAYARHFENSPFSAGAALVVQGGVGWVYSGLNTVFGTRDDVAAQFAVIKLAPAIAWQVNDHLSLGLTFGINYFGGSQELYPNTSCSACLLGGPFNGFRFKGASGIGLNSKLGLQYHVDDDTTIGLTYGRPTSIPLKNGNLRVNFSNLGLGVVRYDNAKLEGFRLPEELALGFAFRPTKPLLVSVQEKWYNWSKALNTLTLTAENPRGAIPAPLQKIVIQSNAGFVDQHVIEIGLAYDYSKDTRIMAGYNYGRQPLPNENVNAIFAPLVTRHIMLGVTHKINPEWELAGGVEMYMPQSATYSSALFGPEAKEHVYTEILHFSASRRW